MDSEDEREAAEFAVGLKHKTVAQANKKNLRNNARLPRTAGLRTLSEMSKKMTEAGLDPSRIEERARVLARARGAKMGRGGDGMDLDEDGDEMEVDGAPSKGRVGNVVAKKGMKPRTDRRLAGMRNAEVSLLPANYYGLKLMPDYSKSPRPSSFVTLVSENPVDLPRLAKVIVILVQKWYAIRFSGCVDTHSWKAEILIHWQTRNGQDQSPLRCLASGDHVCLDSPPTLDSFIQCTFYRL